MQPYAAICQNIQKNKENSPLAAQEVAVLAASKGQDAASITALIAQGVVHFGENKVQEAQSKWPPIKASHPQVRLHLIGALQTNKVREALSLFDVIQTLDRPKLAEEIARIQGRSVDRRSLERGCIEFSGENSGSKQFFVQVNTGEEPQKAGVSPKETADFITYCRALNLNVVGLMCVPPVDAHPAPHFALLRKLALENDLRELSMGMSGDYSEAVRMGSSMVRIGTALFGARGYTAICNL